MAKGEPRLQHRTRFIAEGNGTHRGRAKEWEAAPVRSKARNYRYQLRTIMKPKNHGGPTLSDESPQPLEVIRTTNHYVRALQEGLRKTLPI